MNADNYIIITFTVSVMISMAISLTVAIGIRNTLRRTDSELKQKSSTDVKGVSRREKKRNWKSTAKRLLLGSCVLAIYLVLLIPYVTHTNLDNTGVVVYSQSITVESLPEQIQEICRLKNVYVTTLLLVKHSNPEWTAMAITSGEFPNDAIVEMSGYIVNWRVDWRSFGLVDQPYDRFAIADVRLADPFDSWVENILFHPLGGYLHDVFKLDFYAGPIMLVFLLTLLIEGRLALWNIPAIWSCYSFQVWIQSMIAQSHNVNVAIEWKYFGYLFFALLPVTMYLWYFERSEAGRGTAKKLKAISKALGLSR